MPCPSITSLESTKAGEELHSALPYNMERVSQAREHALVTTISAEMLFIEGAGTMHMLVYTCTQSMQ